MEDESTIKTREKSEYLIQLYLTEMEMTVLIIR